MKLLSLCCLCGQDALLDKCLLNRGSIPTLESVQWTPRYKSSHVSEGFLHFFEVNRQLLKFMANGVTEDIYNHSLKKILPILSSFTSLKSLSLTWDYMSVPDAAFEGVFAGISEITSLEQVHLCGTQSHNGWIINHDLIRTYFSKLRQLRRIAFHSETYQFDVKIEPEEYYRNLSYRCKHSPAGHQDTCGYCQHLLRMCNEKDQFLRLLPRLAWMYVGENSLVIEKHENGTGALFIPKGLSMEASMLRNRVGFERLLW